MLNMPEPHKRALQGTFGRGPVNFTTDSQVHFRNLTLNLTRKSTNSCTRVRIWRIYQKKDGRSPSLASHARPLLRARRGEWRKYDYGTVEEGLEDLVGLERSFADVSNELSWEGEKPGLVM